MRLIPSYLAPSITESWLRRYQVLPGRMHPTMNASGSGGFILHAIKVYACLASQAMLRLMWNLGSISYDDPNATAVTFRQNLKKVPGNVESPSKPHSPMRVDSVECVDTDYEASQMA